MWQTVNIIHNIIYILLCLTVSYSVRYDGNCDTSPATTNADILRPTPSRIIETLTIVGLHWTITLACNTQIMESIHNPQPQSENSQLLYIQNHMETIRHLLTRKYTTEWLIIYTSQIDSILIVQMNNAQFNNSQDYYNNVTRFRRTSISSSSFLFLWWWS